MVGIDIALLVGGAAFLVITAAFVGGRLAPRAEARRRRKQGEQNAELEKRRLDERCTICGGAVDAAEGVWEAGRWWHRGCYREALR